MDFLEIKEFAMTGFYRTTCCVVCALTVLCGFGAQADVFGRCLTEVFDQKMTVYAMPDDLKLQLKLQKEIDPIPIPKEVLDDEGKLKEDFSYKLSFKEYKDRFVLEKPLEVRAENGRRYMISPETAFEFMPPPESQLRVVFVPQINVWQGVKSVQLKIKDLQAIAERI